MVRVSNKRRFQLLIIFLDVVGTAYEGGIFRCRLVIDSEFPQKPPKGKYHSIREPKLP